MLKRVLQGCILAALSLPSFPAQIQGTPIDRHALVTRHNPTITEIDPSAPFMVGNGSIGFTADITGLQTFQDQYSPLVPLMTQAQWAWHSFPNPKNFRISQASRPLTVRGQKLWYPWLENWEQANAPEIKWLRENPHRFSLGRLGLRLLRADGTEASFADITQTKQSLDMWNGKLTSSFLFQGKQVEVETSVHPTRDIIIARVTSPLIFDGRVGFALRFPGVSPNLNPNPADWTNPESHVTQEISRNAEGLKLARILDDTHYSVVVSAERDLSIEKGGPHEYRIVAPRGNTVTLLVEFSQKPPMTAPATEAARNAVAAWWQGYWKNGGVIDFTGSKHPLAKELERRIVLSQYLAAVNQAGAVPPQEEGLFSNSWNGKFHMEMHAWHSAHFAVWGRPELLERSMPWYFANLEGAKERAKSRGVRGAWWPKMVGPEGRESPSTVNPFIMWQQPHPIYLAEALYNARPTRETLDKYKTLVFETAELLVSWPYFDKKVERFILGPPIIPAQESFPPLTTYNPTFELEYWRYGVATAQKWRQRLGLPKNKEWDNLLFRLSKLPEKDGLYLAAESQPDLWERARSPECKSNATGSCPNRDHPSFVAALGLLPGMGVDRETMRRTLDEVVRFWDLRQTWGWDWPMLAMTATRLDEPELAVEFLLTDTKNFQFGVSGMTPRIHVMADSAPHAAGLGVDGPGYRRAAETYFPSNGSLLLAAALMVAGGTGEGALNPGFPANGQWMVRSEGILPLP